MCTSGYIKVRQWVTLALAFLIIDAIIAAVTLGVVCVEVLLYNIKGGGINELEIVW